MLRGSTARPHSALPTMHCVLVAKRRWLGGAERLVLLLRRGAAAIGALRGGGLGAGGMSVIILMSSMRVAVLPGEFDELAGMSEDGALRHADDAGAAAAAELEQSFV